MHFGFPLSPGSSCPKQLLTLLQFHQRPQLQLSNAKLPEWGTRSVTALFWVTFSKRGLNHPPLKKPGKIVLLLGVFNRGKDRLHAPTMQMKPTYIQHPLQFQWLWRKSRWMWKRHPSRFWNQSNRRTQARTVSALVLRLHIPLHHQKMWSPYSKVKPFYLFVNAAVTLYDTPHATGLLTRSHTCRLFFQHSTLPTNNPNPNTWVTNWVTSTCFSHLFLFLYIYEAGTTLSFSGNSCIFQTFCTKDRIYCPKTKPTVVRDDM